MFKKCFCRFLFTLCCFVLLTTICCGCSSCSVVFLTCVYWNGFLFFWKKKTTTLMLLLILWKFDWLVCSFALFARLTPCLQVPFALFAYFRFLTNGKEVCCPRVSHAWPIVYMFKVSFFWEPTIYSYEVMFLLQQ